MTILRSAALRTEDKITIHRLWNAEYPARLSCETIAELEAYLSTLSKQTHYLLRSDAGDIEAWAMTFVFEDEPWFSITVDRSAQGKGKGTVLLDALKADEQTLNGWVIDQTDEVMLDGSRYRCPLPFYEKNGFTLHPELRLELPILSALKIDWRRPSGDEAL